VAAPVQPGPPPGFVPLSRRPAPSAAPSRVRLSARGERLAGFIYGTIVALSMLVAGARAYPHRPGPIAVLVAATSATFWLAHVYAHALGHSVSHSEHLSRAELRHIARRESSIIEAAVPPVGALLLGPVGILATDSAIWLAFGLGLLVLGLQGLQFARIERLGRTGTLAVVTANLGLGLLIVALKLALTHH